MEGRGDAKTWGPIGHRRGGGERRRKDGKWESEVLMKMGHSVPVPRMKNFILRPQPMKLGKVNRSSRAWSRQGLGLDSLGAAEQ